MQPGSSQQLLIGLLTPLVRYRYCPFCKKAKAALQQVLGNNFTVVEVMQMKRVVSRKLSSKSAGLDRGWRINVFLHAA